MKLLSLGNSLFIDDLPLDDGERAEDPLGFASMEVGFRRKFTFLGVGLGVGGIFIPTKSFDDPSEALEGISKRSFCLFQL